MSSSSRPTGRLSIDPDLSARPPSRQVLLLSSKTVVTPTSALAQVTEVVSCLATFAAIALESSQSTAKLESQVKERTAKLQDALAAKTSFLANMSHELRTPLFAVLGLAAVLEDSPGLNSVQREHLATIRTSGEDLQTLISNVCPVYRSITDLMLVYGNLTDRSARLRSTRCSTFRGSSRAVCTRPSSSRSRSRSGT